MPSKDRSSLHRSFTMVVHEKLQMSGDVKNTLGWASSASCLSDLNDFALWPVFKPFSTHSQAVFKPLPKGEIQKHGAWASNPLCRSR